MAAEAAILLRWVVMDTDAQKHPVRVCVCVEVRG